MFLRASTSAVKGLAIDGVGRHAPWALPFPSRFLASSSCISASFSLWRRGFRWSPLAGRPHPLGRPRAPGADALLFILANPFLLLLVVGKNQHRWESTTSTRPPPPLQWWQACARVAAREVSQYDTKLGGEGGRNKQQLAFFARRTIVARVCAPNGLGLLRLGWFGTGCRFLR